MTLRARLTMTMLAVAVIPVVTGGVVVIVMSGADDRSHDRARLDAAVTSLRTAVGATCDRLQAAASAASAATVGGVANADAATAVVASGEASGVRVDGASSTADLTTAGAPSLPWTLCPSASVRPDASDSLGAAMGAPAAIAAAVPLAGPGGGYVYAAQALDDVYLHRLSAEIGANVVPNASHASTESGALARRVAPIAGLRADFTVSVPATTRRGLLPGVAVIAAFAAVLAVATAARVARVTSRRPSGSTAVEVDARAMHRDVLRGNLDVLGDTLSSTHDLPRILRVILGSAIAATGAARGAVLLVDGERGLVLQCSDGFGTDNVDAASSAMNAAAGVLGSVAATGIARRGRIAATRASTVRATDTEPGTYLAVPMTVPATTGSAGRDVPTADVSASVRGVLALYDRIGGGEFDEGDLRTVRTFAGHAAVAVDNVRLHDEARRLSHTDPLTGLYNYRHLQEMLEREISRSARFEHPLCVMALDLDLFKDVNDTYGHGAGDAVLVEFARRLGAVIRGVDLAFRAGGEEFVLLLPETGAPGGVVLAQRLGAVIRDSKMTVPDTLRATADLNTMELPLVRLATQAASPGSPASARATSARDGSTGQPRHIADVPITVSIGVAVFPEHGTTGGQLLEAADRALYAAKSGGRDTYRVAVHRPPPNPVASSGEDAAASAGDGPDDAAEPVAVAVTSGEGRDDGHRDRPAAVSPPGTAGRGIRPRRGSDDGASPVGGGDRPDGESTTGPPARQPPGR